LNQTHVDERTGGGTTIDNVPVRDVQVLHSTLLSILHIRTHTLRTAGHTPRARLATRAGLRGLASYRPGLSRGAISRRRSRHADARARGTIRPSARITCKHVDPRCPRGPRLALRRRPLVLGSVRNAHGASQPATPLTRLHHVASTRFSRPADRRLQPN